MAGKKGVTPSHVTKKQFDHPGIEHPIVRLLDQVEDPRHPSLFLRHPLTSMLFMVVVAILCGANDWPKVVVIAQGLTSWLGKYVDMSAGVPCERTFKNLINALNPEALEKVLRDLAGLIQERTPQCVIGFDGQTSKGTADKRADVKPMHFLSAWSSNDGICLGHLKVDDKSNEITAMPQLMELLDLKNTIVTADALNTQKSIVAKAIDQGADYVLPVKGNHPQLLEEVVATFDGVDEERAQAKLRWEHALEKARENRDEPRLKRLLTDGPSACHAFLWVEPTEKLHGRLESRSCMSLEVGNLSMKEEWKGIATLARVSRERIVGGKTTQETTYYISSLRPDRPDQIGQAVREHWGVENGLHWRLDVVFKQDKSRYRDRVGAQNLATIRKMVLNALAKDSSIKGGLATKQCAAACNPDYRDRIIKKVF